MKVTPFFFNSLLMISQACTCGRGDGLPHHQHSLAPCKPHDSVSITKPPRHAAAEPEPLHCCSCTPAAAATTWLATAGLVLHAPPNPIMLASPPWVRWAACRRSRDRWSCPQSSPQPAPAAPPPPVAAAACSGEWGARQVGCRARLLVWQEGLMRRRQGGRRRSAAAAARGRCSLAGHLHRGGMRSPQVYKPVRAAGGEGPAASRPLAKLRGCKLHAGPPAAFQ